MKLIFSVILLANVVGFANAALNQSQATQRALRFSQQPTEAEIFRARVFDEPLIPMGGAPSKEETSALAHALVGYATRTNLHDFSALTGFLLNAPRSVWNGSLLLHLGTEYYNYGYYSKALESWEESWQRLQGVTDVKGKPQADRALGELVRIYSKLGRMGDLERLLDATQGRPLTGPATQMLANGRDAIRMMKIHPEVSFRCGPMALDRILAHKDRMKGGNPLVMQSRSTTNGFSLLEVARLSQKLGLNYQAAFRFRGAPLILPSVVHWKADHYAALLEQKGDLCLVQDPTFYSSHWVLADALDDEGSGYFLVPSGSLPTGWRAVGEAESARVFGKGIVGGPASGGPGPQGPNTPSGGPCGGGGMTAYSMNIAFVSLTLTDTPVGYTPPVGPWVKFNATYNQGEPNQPATFDYSNLGPKWTCDWISYVTDTPNNPGANVSLYQSGGGTLYFSGFNPATQSYAPELETRGVLTLTSPSSYLLTFPNGASRIFSVASGSGGSTRHVFLSQILDPAGNAVKLHYDAELRITNIVDTIGQLTSVFYTNAAFPYAITSVTDPFGRTAGLQYYTNGLLAQMTDVLGLTSQYIYSANDFATALQTPYGTTTFATGQTNGITYLSATDPLGATEFLEFNDNSPIASNDPLNLVPHGMGTTDTYLIYRNSFYWSKQAWQLAPGDYSKAVLYHFLHDSLNSGVESNIPESIKKPLENRVWYNYPGQSGAIFSGSSSRPTAIGRVLDDGTTQISYYRYNVLGNVTNSVDPVGRAFTYIYATNNLDLIEVHMTHNGKDELQSRRTYNSQHAMLTFTDASGQTTTNTYNAAGQILSTTDALGEVTTFSYATNGYLLSITGPLQNSSDVTSFTYDAFGRARAVTDVQGYTLIFDYDAANRKTRVTHPDGTFEQFVYGNLDLVATADRIGRWTTNSYDANRHLVQTRDPLGRVTTFDRCKCGALEGITDPLGRTTSWDRDVQGRPVAKHYADGSTITYTYENTTSRLRNRRDEKGQDTFYEYYQDNRLKRRSYPNAIVATPTVTFTYDPDYDRVLTMQDGIGTTAYAYNPITSPPVLGAGRLASVTGPLPNSTVTYQYDALGRTTSRAINGVAEATQFDTLGRPVVVTNALGTFQYSYQGATPRVVLEAYPNRQTNLYSYYDNQGDDRLEAIQHLYPNGSLLSGHGYVYNPAGQITAWTNEWDTLPTRVWLPNYDAAGQLTNVLSVGGPSTITNYGYGYDLAGNRVLAATNGSLAVSSYNALNQLQATSAAPTNPATYEWDAENRLTAINQGTNRSEFSYDGLGRRVEIVEKANGALITNNFFLWCGNRICDVRDATAQLVLRHLFAHGESVGVSNSVAYYYTRDHIRNVREALDVLGGLRARFDFDPYGRIATVTGGFQPALGYTGHFLHRPSGLYLTLKRAYDSNSGRWLSRDPLGLRAGLNLYGYVGGDPINRIDPHGEFFFLIVIPLAEAAVDAAVLAEGFTEVVAAEEILGTAALDAEAGAASAITQIGNASMVALGDLQIALADNVYLNLALGVLATSVDVPIEMPWPYDNPAARLADGIKTMYDNLTSPEDPSNSANSPQPPSPSPAGPASPGGASGGGGCGCGPLCDPNNSAGGGGNPSA